MAPPSFTIQDVQRSLPSAYVERGQEYLEQGRVSGFHHAEQNHYQASVQGSGSQPYRVDVRLVHGKTGKQIYGLCTCPMRVNCKHVAAVLLRALQGPPPEERRTALETTQAERSAPRTLPAEPPSAEPPFELRLWLDRASRALSPAAERNDYAPNVLHRLLYLLAVEVRGGRRAELRLMLGRQLKAGGYSDVRPWGNARDTLRKPASFVLSADQRVLRMLLLDASTIDDQTFFLTGESGGRILHEVLATGRCHLDSDSAPRLREGPARPGELRWQYSDTGAQHIVCDTVPSSQHVIPLSPLWYVDVGQGLCGPVQTALPPAIAEALAAAPPIPPEHAAYVRDALSEGQAEQQLWPLPTVPRCADVREGVPVPCLRLVTLQAYGRSTRPLGQYLDLAVLTFEYEGVRVELDSPLILQTVRDGELIRLKRDTKREKRCRDILHEAGFVQLQETTHFYPYQHAQDYTLRDPAYWPDFVVRRLPQLRTQGWKVELDDSFRFRPAEVGEWYADVQESGTDWFDLTLGVDVDGQRRNVLPILLTAIRARPDLLRDTSPAASGEGDSLIVILEDGRLMPVPLARVRPLMSILHELVDIGLTPKVRLRRLDAARLADLENEADLKWSGGERIRQFGARLASFTRVEPVPAPRGLQAELRPYQSQGLAWLQFLRAYDLHGILADDMGLGKTVQALAHILIEKEAGRLDHPVLVVAPTSVVPNWQAETARFAPSLRVHLSHGLKRKEAFGQFAHSDLVLTTYPLLARDREALLAQQFHLVILDEAQQIKNAQTQAARVVTHLKARHRLCLTGTPLENHLGELWSLFHFLMPGFLGDTDTFRRLYRTPIEKRGDEPRRRSLARRIRPFVLRRTKEQVAVELPPKTEMVENVEIGGAQGDLYETVRAAMDQRVRAEIAVRGLAQSQIVVLDALLKLRQVCCDPRLLKLDAAKKVKDSAKLARLLDMLEQLLAEGRRVLLFSQFTSMLELIEPELKARGIAYVKLTGETRDRKKPVDAFQSGKAPLFLISLKAGGTGLNLTAADTVIHYDPWWNPAVENQATDRAHRIGQDKPVFVYKLIVAGSVEEKIAALQASKAALAAGVLGEGGAASAQLTQEDVAALFEPLR